MFRYFSYYVGICLFLAALHFSEANAVLVSGFVVDASGNPIPNVDLDFIDAATGVKLVFPPGFNDNTNTLGGYSIDVLAGVYHITYDPRDSSHFLGARILNVDLSANRDTIMPDIVLGYGVAVSGVVTDSNGTPLSKVNIDVDSIGGGRVYTSNDKTKLLTGAYWVVVPPGNFRLRYKPPVGSRLRGLQLDSVTIARDTIINVSMGGGAFLDGIVTDSAGKGLEDIDVELRDIATGKKIFVSRNNTDSTGYYNVVVPAGVFELRFTPPRGNRYLAALIDSFTISGDMTWNQLLGAGLICSVYVHDSAGNPVAGIDLDFKQDSSGNKLFTPGDKSNAAGYAVVSLPPDVYIIQLQPPLGTIYDQLVVRGVPIFADTLFDFLMPEVQRVNWTGQVTNSFGQGLPDIKIDPVFRISGTKAFVANNVTDSSGNFNVAVPIGNYDVLISPPKGSRYVATVVENVTFGQDTTWQPVSLFTGLFFSAFIFGDQGRPVVGADLDLTSQTTGRTLFTPFDNSDDQGMAQVTVPPDRYIITVEPPAGSGLTTSFASDVDISADTTAYFFLVGTGGGAGPESFILQHNYPNPFNSETNIQFLLLVGSEVRLSVYNTLGQRVKILKQGYYPPGLYLEKWNATDHTGSAVASGVYFYELITDTDKESQRMVLVK